MLIKLLSASIVLSLRVEQRKPAKRRSSRECVTCAPAHLKPQKRFFSVKVTAGYTCIATVQASLSPSSYEELTANSTPFICLVCTQRLHKAQVLVLQNELASLKSELLELRTVIAYSSVRNAISLSCSARRNI